MGLCSVLSNKSVTILQLASVKERATPEKLSYGFCLYMMCSQDLAW
jgi:hypothetical protein